MSDEEVQPEEGDLNEEFPDLEPDAVEELHRPTEASEEKGDDEEYGEIEKKSGGLE